MNGKSGLAMGFLGGFLDQYLSELALQRDILGILVARSYQHNSGIDKDAVLCYPLAPVSIPLRTPDGSMRKTAKSKLFTAAMNDLRIVTKDSLPGPDKLNTYFLEVAAAVQSIVGKPDTIRELAMRSSLSVQGSIHGM